MSFSLIDTWVIARQLAGQQVNGELALMSDELRPLGNLLETMQLDQRIFAFQGAKVLRPDRQELQKAVADSDPNAPAPVQQPQTFATVADVRLTMAQERWECEGWFPRARVVGIAAGEGVGKTRFALDLARRIYLNEPWHDGQPMTFPAGTPTLWLCSDGHQDEIAEALPLLGLPDEAVVFPAPPSDPYANTDLDEPDTLTWLDQAIAAVKPAITFIDTLTYATSMDLCEQRSVAGLKGPLIDLVQRHQTIIALLLHLSKEGQALGRRIKGITRTLMHLECPDPDQPDRLRLWVEKSFAKKPPAMGVTIKADGNAYDFTPPAPKVLVSGGRPAVKRDAVREFISNALTAQNDQVANDLCVACEKKLGASRQTFWRAIKKMEDEGDVISDGGTGTGKQTVLHLNSVQNQNP